MSDIVKSGKTGIDIKVQTVKEGQQLNILVPVLTGLAAVGVGFIAVIQIPAMQDLVSGKAVNVLGFDDNELTTEEQLAIDRQALSEQQAQLSWKKTCAVRNIDDLKCESLWKE